MRAGLPTLSRASLRARLPPGAEWRRVGLLLLRILAGVGGGYLVAALLTAVLSLGLPLPRAEAVLTATMASFAVHAAAIVWAFAARSAVRALLGVIAAAVVLAAVLLALPLPVLPPPVLPPSVLQGALP